MDKNEGTASATMDIKKIADNKKSFNVSCEALGDLCIGEMEAGPSRSNLPQDPSKGNFCLHTYTRLTFTLTVIDKN